MRRFNLLLLLLLSLLAWAQELSAQERSRIAKDAAKESSKAKEVVPVTPEREAAAAQFVAEQHPELAELLKHLKETNPRQYEKAVRELFATSEHLAQVQSSDKQRYELELQVWKLHSRLQLLSAKLTMNPSENLKQELKTILAEQYDARRAVLSYDRDKIRDRMKKAEKDLADYEARRESAIKKQFDLLTATKPKPEKKKEEKSANTTSP
jgi:hypothetical protein